MGRRALQVTAAGPFLPAEVSITFLSVRLVDGKEPLLRLSGIFHALVWLVGHP